jgi:energy-converting hydrogenase Eha subunit E
MSAPLLVALLLVVIGGAGVHEAVTSLRDPVVRCRGADIPVLCIALVVLSLGSWIAYETVTHSPERPLLVSQ